MTTKTTITFSMPYYHSIYSHSQPEGNTDGKKVHAPTFTPEIVTLPSVVPISSLPVQTMACDMRIKKEKTSSSYSCCNQSLVSTQNATSTCQTSPKLQKSSTINKQTDSLEQLKVESNKRKGKDKSSCEKDVTLESENDKHVKKSAEMCQSNVMQSSKCSNKSKPSSGSRIPNNENKSVHSDGVTDLSKTKNQLTESVCQKVAIKPKTKSNTTTKEQQKEIPNDTEPLSEKEADEQRESSESLAVNLVKEKSSASEGSVTKAEQQSTENNVPDNASSEVSSRKKTGKHSGKRQSGKLKSSHEDGLGTKINFDIFPLILKVGVQQNTHTHIPLLIAVRKYSVLLLKTSYHDCL